MPEFCKLRRVANRGVRRLLGPGALDKQLVDSYIGTLRLLGELAF
jgi:hypothetical protein